MEQTQKPDMGEVIKSILQAEERAAEIAEQAAAECKGIIAEAEAKAAAIKAEAEEDVKEKLRQESVSVKAEAARRSALAAQECDGEKKRLAKLAGDNSAEAVKIILEQLDGKNAG